MGIIKVVVFDATGQIEEAVWNGSAFIVVGPNPTDVVITGTGPGSDNTEVTVDGLLVDYRVFIETELGFDRMEIFNAAASKPSFDISGITIGENIAGSDIPMTFDLQVSDADDDTAAGTLAMTTIPDNGSDIVGTGADEALIGGSGGDTLTGGGGGDILTGGTGADTFVYSAGDGGATVALADLITDFDDGTDMIGLAGGLTFGALTIDQSADVVGDGTLDTVISVTVGGEILTVLDGITTTIDMNDFTVIV